MTPADLKEFEAKVVEFFLERKIRSPVHLSGGNEEKLIEIFKDVKPGDYVFSTYRGHYHALLKGVPSSQVMEEILQGRSMNFCFPEYKFYTSALVGSTCPQAVGVAAALRGRESKIHVWVFLGDMASHMGIFRESLFYAERQNLNMTFVIENNGYSTNTLTIDAWGTGNGNTVKLMAYPYTRIYPHMGVGKWVQF